MSTELKLLSVIFACFCLFACNKMGEDVEQPADLESAGSLTAEFKSATAATATFECELTRHPDAGNSFKAGIMYSTSQRFTTSSAKRAVIENPVDGVHELSLNDLIFDTKYYYATYVYHFGKYELSEVRSFTTEKVNVEIDVVDVKHSEVTIAGQVHLEPDQVGKVRAGFKFSDVKDFSSQTYIEATLELDEDGNFEIKVTGLEQGTPYFYTYYLTQSGSTYQAPVKSLITSSPYIENFGELDIAAATDLSATESANCYMISAPGLYKFKAVKGNSQESIGEVSVVHLLWESIGEVNAPNACELIAATSYKDGYVAINVPAAFRQGNAVVVAKSALGEILWSWHLWLTSDQPKEHVYANGAGVMMDRNLGALSVEKGDPRAFGLLYQWGRKDPFPGSATNKGTAMVATTAKMYVTVPTAKEGTIDYAVKNPTTMILGASDWLYYSNGTVAYDNTRWQSEKTKYDPCPAGWRVPDGGPINSVKVGEGEDAYYVSEGGGIWAKAGIPNGGGFPYPVEDYNSAGITIPAQYCGEDAWYPAAGSISPSDGSFVEVGRDGMYWSVTPCGPTEVYGFNFYYYMQNTGYLYLAPMFTRASAASVRCCKIL